MAIFLDLSSFNSALSRLDEALLAHAEKPSDTLIRDAVIQRFEFSYELATKMLKRYVELSSASPTEIDAMAFPDLIRTASEQGLLQQGWDVWKEYRKARGTTSHAYDEAKAQEVLLIVPKFRDDASALLLTLKSRIQAP